MISVKIDGMDRINKAIASKQKALTSGVDIEIAGSIATINRDQKALAPVSPGGGLLRSSLKIAKVAPLNYEIVSTGPGSSYAPYQEFGTGGLVTIPAGLEAEAAQFKGRGVRKVNMRAQPFFYSPLFKERPKLVKRIKEILK